VKSLGCAQESPTFIAWRNRSIRTIVTQFTIHFGMDSGLWFTIKEFDMWRYTYRYSRYTTCVHGAFKYNNRYTIIKKLLIKINRRWIILIPSIKLNIYKQKNSLNLNPNGENTNHLSKIEMKWLKKSGVDLPCVKTFSNFLHFKI